MPKQVRLRRGTTSQHSAFTGADGELTIDTTKRCLVIHDGVTAGGKPVTGFLLTNPGDPSSTQEVASILRITGGDGSEIAFEVPNSPASFLKGIGVAVAVVADKYILDYETLPYAASIQLNFETKAAKSITLAGNLALTTANLRRGMEARIRIIADASLRTLSFSAPWKFLGSAPPPNIPANKTALLTLYVWGTGVPTDADVQATWEVQP